MTSSLLSAHLLFSALEALDAAAADLDLVAVIEYDSALATDAAVIAGALEAEADALETLIVRRVCF
jgi:hypothetical protein